MGIREHKDGLPRPRGPRRSGPWGAKRRGSSHSGRGCSTLWGMSERSYMIDPELVWRLFLVAMILFFGYLFRGGFH